MQYDIAALKRRLILAQQYPAPRAGVGNQAWRYWNDTQRLFASRSDVGTAAQVAAKSSFEERVVEIKALDDPGAVDEHWVEIPPMGELLNPYPVRPVSEAGSPAKRVRRD